MTPRRRRSTAASAIAWCILAGIIAVGQFLDDEASPEAPRAMVGELFGARAAASERPSVVRPFTHSSTRDLFHAPFGLPARDTAPRIAATHPERPRRTLPQPFAALRAVTAATSPLIMPRLLSLPRVLTPRLEAIEGLAERARPGQPVAVVLSAYCLQGFTRRGREVRPGIIAADPTIFPLARHVELTVGGRYLGKFLVDDTGKKIRGTRIDIWTPDCTDARRFGMRSGVATLVAVSER